MGMPQITASTARRSSMRCWSSSEEKSFPDTFSASTASVTSALSLVAFIVLVVLLLRFLRSGAPQLCVVLGAFRPTRSYSDFRNDGQALNNGKLPKIEYERVCWSVPSEQKILSIQPKHEKAMGPSNCRPDL